MIESSRAVDPATGQIVGGVPSHPAYFLISRGQSQVKIDEGTGTIFLWDVQPEDDSDFQPLLSPRPDTGGSQ